MDTEHIREFIALARIKNYSAAADSLFISQATLSRHIMILEEEIGCPLFERSTRSVSLTETGYRFLPFAFRLIETENESKKSLLQLQKQLEKTLTVGLINSVVDYGVIQLCEQFMKNNPGVSFLSIEGSTNQLIQNVTTGMCDLSFIMEPEALEPNCKPENELSRILITQDTLAVLLPSNHPLANSTSINLNALSNEKFLMPGRKRSLYRVYMDICRQAGFEPKLFETSIHGRAAMDMVKHHRCIMLQYRKNAMVLGADRKDFALVDIEPKHNLLINAIYCDSLLSDVAKIFIEFLKSLQNYHFEFLQ